MSKLTKSEKSRRDMIKKSIQEHNNCKENTCRSYVISLSKLMGSYEKLTNKSVRNIAFLKDYKNVIKSLPEKLTTKKNTVTAILVLLRHNKKMENIYKNYREYSSELRKQYDKFIQSHEKSDSQRKNWVSWKKLLEIQKEYANMIKEKHYNKKKDLTKKQFLLLQDYVLVSLYTLEQPYRAEYADVRITTMKDYNKISDIEKQKNNWLVVKSRNSKWFWFMKYKTQKKFKNLKIIVEPKLNSVLNLWLKFNRPEDKNNWWLLYNTSLKKMTKNNIIKALQRVFSGTGKKISINMLRHIYATEGGQLKDVDIDKLVKDARDMKHSVQTHLNYIKK